MEDTSEYLVYSVNVGRRKDKFRRNHVSFGDVCYDKLVISLSKVDILRIEVEDMK